MGTDEADGEGRKKSLLIWLSVGCVVLLAIALCGWLLWPAKGFTLIVRGAPPGSTVYVDNVELGPTDASGSRVIHELEPGKRTIVIANKGYKDFVSTVVAQRGTEEVVIANLEKTGSDTPAALPKEIDFAGIMVLIPAGDFIMGDDTNVKNESPAHTVNLSDFYIDKFEVTNAQYKAFCEATQRPTPTNTTLHKEYFNNEPNFPVIGVSWQDAAAYADWANKRLPSEEEWEKAASWDPAAQKKRQWPWGDKAEAERANVDSPKKTKKEPYEVGRHPRDTSAYGVMDMAGNASEWVDAFYQPYVGNQIADPDFGITNKVIRGGNFAQLLDQARTTRRQFALPTFRESVENGNEYNSSAGFRCAISANDPRLQESLRKK
jgi:formylglycine-generating enzyme required for sulfatase activity